MFTHSKTYNTYRGPELHLKEKHFVFQNYIQLMRNKRRFFSEFSKKANKNDTHLQIGEKNTFNFVHRIEVSVDKRKRLKK